MSFGAKAVLLAVFACAVDAAAGKQGGQGGNDACSKKKIDGDFRKCMADAKGASGAKAACEAAMKEAMIACGQTAPDAVGVAKDVKKAAEGEMAACRMNSTMSKADCRKKFDEMTGKTGPSDPTERENKDKFNAAKGAPSALADKMASCLALSKTKETCRGEMKQDMETLAGRTISQEEFEFDARKAGNKAGGDAVKECIKSATDAEAKKACFSSDEALDAIAKASGRNKADLNEMDTKKAAKDGASDAMRGLMEACNEAAGADVAAKKACRTRPDLKDELANSLGVSKSDILDSSVREIIEQAAAEELLTAARTCDKADLAKCKAAMKEVLEKVLGKPASNITDSELKFAHQSVMRGDIADRMGACMSNAANAAAKAKCKDAIKEAMKMADFENSGTGRDPKMKDVEKMLREAGKAKAGEAMLNCNASWTRATCLTELQKRVAESMGKDLSDMTKSEAEMLNRDGAFTAAREAAEACAAAKLDNPSATCEDITQKFRDVRKTQAASSTRGKKAESAKVTQGVAIDLGKAQRSACLDSADKAAFEKCMLDNKGSKDATMNHIFSTLSAGDRQKRVNTAEHDSSKLVLGERFQACMTAALGVKADEDACKDALNADRAKTGVVDDAEDVIREFNADMVAKASQACVEASSKKQCREDAKNSAKKNGMKEREFGMVKRTGELTAAAKAWSACKMDAASTDADCEADAKAVFETVSGTSDAAAWDAVKDKVKKIGGARKDGKQIKQIKQKRIDVDAVTSATACTDALKTAFNSMLTEKKADVSADMGNKTLGAAQSRGAGCRVVDGKAEVSGSLDASGLNDAEIETASDKLAVAATAATLTVTRRLGEERRLATVNVESPYVAQGVELCASDDSTGVCASTGTGASTSIPPGSSTTGTGASTTTLPGSPVSSAWRYSVSAIAMLLVASSL